MSKSATPFKANTTSYTGRFAPSPTGPLHFGSLLAALASYLDARIHQGQWLVRMEDLDPPREVAGAADDILRTLERYGLLWDGPVLYQSQRTEVYEAAISQLRQQQLAYACDCSRLQIQQRGAQHYDDFCRSRQQQVGSSHAIRVITDDRSIEFTDRLQGSFRSQLHRQSGDFVIKRKDGFYAYQLAVVIDDADQGVSHIVRGSDLLDSTPRQLYLQQLLKLPQPVYGHIPVIINAAGQKLSKQTFAAALDPQTPGLYLCRALALLGMQTPADFIQESPATILQWAQQHWSLSKVPHTLTVEEDS